MPFFASPARRIDNPGGSFLTPGGALDCRKTDGGLASHAKSLFSLHGPVLAATSLRSSYTLKPHWFLRPAQEAWS
jgi:hypothetical protein